MQGFGVVKSVLSGDTLVLQGAPTKAGPAPELLVGLSNVQAPRISRHPDQKDEPFAFQSREFVRKLVIGRQVKFRIDGTSATGGAGARQFATIWHSPDSKESLNHAIAAAGLVKAVDSSGARGDEHEAIQAVNGIAQDGNQGLFAHDQNAGVRRMIWTLTAEQATALAAELSGKAVPAIVEGVTGGATLRVCIPLPANGPHIMTTFHMAGVQCPRAGVAPTPGAAATGAAGPAAGGPGKQPAQKAGTAPAAAAAGAPVASGSEKGEPYGNEARSFTESRLIHRDVTLHIGGADKSGAFVGQVEHPAGDIAAELVKSGLGKVVDWSASFDNPGHVGALRAAERSAKAAKIKIWSAYEPSVSKIPASAREYMGRVVEVVSGDTIVVLTNPNRAPGVATDERRVSLSSVRAPRLGNIRRDEKDAPYAWEAKEHLRKLLVGRDVHVAVDYTRASAGAEEGGAGGPGGAHGGPKMPDRVYGTVTLETKKGESVNIAVGLLEAGYAEVTKHRADEDRARDYDRLLEAETTARSGKKGIHNAKDAPIHRIADISSDPAKSKAQFPFLKRSGTLRAVVDYCFAGGRVKLFLPSENVSIMFGVAGVRCPAVGKPGGAAGAAKPGAGAGAGAGPRDSEPMGPEALQWMRENVMQIEVEIEAEDVDRNGTVLGPMYVGKGGARKNVGAELLRKGLGRGVWPVIERVRDSEELVAAEEDARTSKRGLWAFVKEEEDEEATNAAGAPGKALGDAFAALNLDASANVPSPAAAGAGGSSVTAQPPIPCVLADISDGRNFTLQAEGDRDRIEEVNNALDALLESHGTAHAMVPDIRKGKVLAALFEEEGGKRWYRARIEGKAKPLEGAAKSRANPDEAGLERWEVTYIDYGNSAVLTVLSMRPLEPSISSHPPFARRGGLAYLRVPGVKEESGPEAAAALSDTAFGRPLLAHAHGVDTLAPESDTAGAAGAPPRLALELVDAETGSNVNEQLVAGGLARVARTEARKLRRRLGLAVPPKGVVPSASFYEAEGRAVASLGLESHPDYAYLRKIEQAQDEARRSRAGMWRYGDVADSDLEDSGPSGPGTGGARRGSGGGAASGPGGAPKAAAGAWAARAASKK